MSTTVWVIPGFLGFAAGVVIAWFVTWRYFSLQRRQARERVAQLMQQLEESSEYVSPATVDANVGAAMSPGNGTDGLGDTFTVPRSSVSVAARITPMEPDVSGAASILRKKIRANDLTAIEGIGAKIAELVKADGIATWEALAKTDVARLRRILDNAGPRYRVHDPTSWPHQAELLAQSKWEEFKTLTDGMRGN